MRVKKEQNKKLENLPAYFFGVQSATEERKWEKRVISAGLYKPLPYSRDYSLMLLCSFNCFKTFEHISEDLNLPLMKRPQVAIFHSTARVLRKEHTSFQLRRCFDECGVAKKHRLRRFYLNSHLWRRSSDCYQFWRLKLEQNGQKSGRKHLS